MDHDLYREWIDLDADGADIRRRGWGPESGATPAE